MSDHDRNDRGARAPRIDVHAHMLPSRAVVAARTGERWHGVPFELDRKGDVVLRARPDFQFRFNPHYWESPAERHQQVVNSGLDLQLACASGPLLGHGFDVADAISACREINDELAEHSADPALGGLAVVPLQDTAAAVAELERAHGIGLAGVALRAQVDGENWDAERLFPVLQAAADAQLLVLFHPDPWTGITDLGRYHVPDVIGQSGQVTMAAAALIFGGVLDRLPHLLVCLGQAGGYVPFVGGRFDQAFRLWREDHVVASLPSEYLRRMYFDCLTFSEAALRCLFDVAGVERVVAGTDFPSVQALANPGSWLAAAGLNATDIEQILGGNLSTTAWAARLRPAGLAGA
jgi:aminocarboxymuconate-semialdehyde decarboxylase